MAEQALTELLNRWSTGELSLAELEHQLAAHYGSTAMLDGIRLDIDRVRRCGYPEVIYGAGKSLAQLQAVLRTQRGLGQPSLITRCDPMHAAELHAEFPELIQNSLARTVRLGQLTADGQPRVVVVTAGATDRAVAEEAAETALWMGCAVELLADVGVAGPWRLIEQRHRLTDADTLVVVAGMEGALPSVVAGWVRCPVIAVPTSVGYGANLQGMSALLSMLNSCAANVAVVNIDAGFKGGYLAGIIARQTATARSEAKRSGTQL